MIISRPEEDINSEIREWASDDNIIAIESSHIHDDIRSYVHGKVRNDSGFKRWRSRPDVQEEIETRLLDKADGITVWTTAAFVLNSHHFQMA
ncbi:hypothetical protein PENSUB_12571 [Penicillium subrubescens]|uniref:Uncharacterized protein n=1 Tax=Penicillium subrubescens TaxID=1316194 RepID=A0A1Q5UQ77_9EURO|nr:hypothetical protein PENSUB_12571 [Penicillium subrubescens]